MSGQESASARTIAWRFVALKSDHIVAGPVARTVTPGLESPDRRRFSRPAARTISSGGAPASPSTTTVRRSRETLRPARGTSTPPIAGSDRRAARTSASVSATAGASNDALSDATTTGSAYPPRPGKAACTRSRARSDSECEASQPAPERAPSANGASAPSAMTSTTQAPRTTRRWSAVHPPSRTKAPVMPARIPASCSVSTPLRTVSVCDMTMLLEVGAGDATGRIRPPTGCRPAGRE